MPMVHMSLEFCCHKAGLMFLFAITADGVVPCGSPKKSSDTLSFWSFEISEDTARK